MTILLQGAGLQVSSSGTPADPIGDALRAAAIAYYTMNQDT